MYGPRGERRLTELELTWLPGYESRGRSGIGNAAVDQLQLDVYGEVMDALYLALATASSRTRRRGRFSALLIEFLETRVEASRTRASGRCADRVGISLTRR